MADIRLAKPAAGAAETVPCEPSARFVFDFPATDATLARDGDNLTISFQDGSSLQLQDFYKEYNEDNLPSFSVDGTDVAAADFFEAMNEPDLMPAAGPGTGTAANGARFHEWGDSSLTGGIQHLDGLDWGFSRAFEWEDHPNAVGYHDDEWDGNNPVTLTPERPGPLPPNTPDLPVEGIEPGSIDPTAPTDVRFIREADVRGGKLASVKGAMQVEAPDGVATIEIAGHALWANGALVAPERIPTDEGYFHNFAYDAASGRLTYTFTLTEATREHTAAGRDLISHSLPVVVRDVDGDSAYGRLTIVIEDDVPEITVSGAQAATAVFGADDVLTDGSLRSLEVSFSGSTQSGRPEVNGNNVVLWQKNDGEPGTNITNIDELAQDESATSGDLMVTRHGDTFEFAFVSDAPKAGTNYGLELRITDADGDVSTARLPMTVPLIPTYPFTPTGGGDDEPGGEGAQQLYAATILMDEGGNPQADGHDGHALDNGTGSFRANLNGETGHILVGTKDAGYLINIGENGQEIKQIGDGIAEVNGIKVTIATDPAEALYQDPRDGIWEVRFNYTLTGRQDHPETDLSRPDSLNHDINILVTDASGDQDSARIHVELHDDVTKFDDTTDSSSEELTAPDNFSLSFHGDSFVYTGFTKGTSLWQQKADGSVNKSENDYPSHLHGDGTENGVNFNMTASFVHYEYSVDDQGHLTVTNVVDISKTIAASGKAFAMGKDGLGMGSAIDEPWNGKFAGEFSTGARLTNDSSLTAIWVDDKNNHTAQYNMMKDAYGDNFTGGAISAANVSEAVVFDLNDIAYGIKLDLGSFGEGDRVLVSFLMTAPYSDDNHVYRTVEINYDDLTPAPEGAEGKFVPGTSYGEKGEIEVLEDGVHLRIKAGDGFTKAFVSALGSAKYEGDGLQATLQADEKETSGFSIKDVEFLTPQWTQAGTVEAHSADVSEDQGIVYGWDPTAYDGKTVEVQGYYAGSYTLEVVQKMKGDEPVLDENGAPVWAAIMTGGKYTGPDGKEHPNLYNGHALFEFALNKDGAWTYKQFHEFTVGGSNERPFVITATDLDGDVAEQVLKLGDEFVPYDELLQGHYQSDYGTNPANDKADDVLLGSNGASLLYGKGGDDLVLGDRFEPDGGAAVEPGSTDPVAGIINDISGQKNNNYKDHDGETFTDKLHGKLDGLDHDQLGALAVELEKHETPSKDENDAPVYDKDGEPVHIGGKDLIYGGVGDDILLGMAGDDKLYGEKGDDYLFGGSGADYLDGGAGKDVLAGGTGHDILVGGTGGTEMLPVNANFAFLVDVSGNFNQEDVTSGLKEAFRQLVEQYADNPGKVNVLLYGFHSYGTHMASVKLSDANAYDNLVKALNNITGYDEGMSVYEQGFYEDAQAGSNHALAINYAQGWFAAHKTGGENQIFMVSSNDPSYHLADRYTDGFTYGQKEHVIAPTKTNDYSHAEMESIRQYVPEVGYIKLEGYEPGKIYEITATDNNGKTVTVGQINKAGAFELVGPWKITTKNGVTLERKAGDPVGVKPGKDSSGREFEYKASEGEGAILAVYNAELGWTLGYVAHVGDDKTESDNYSTYLQNTIDGDVTSRIVFVNGGDIPDSYTGTDVETGRVAFDGILAGMPDPTYAGDTLLGGAGNDVLFGDSMPDAFAGKNAAEILNDVKQAVDDPDFNPSKWDVAGDRAENDYLDGGKGEDVLFGGRGDDYLDGGADGDYLFGGEGNDLIVYDANDYLVDGGAGIDFLLAPADTDPDNPLSLDTLLQSPRFNDVEVLLKGVDTASLTSMKDLADSLGLRLEKGADGQDRLVVDMDQWHQEGDIWEHKVSNTNGEETTDGITMETANLTQDDTMTTENVTVLKVFVENGSV